MRRNLCISLLRKSKTSYFQNLHSRVVSDDKFWKGFSPLFSNKVKWKEKLISVENN